MKPTVVLAFVILCVSISFAQGAKPKPKPAAKPTPQAGAVQLPGDNGKVNVPYKLGKKDDELVFILESAAFVDRVVVKDNVLVPQPGKRLLLLNVAVQNPSSKQDRIYFEQSFKFTAVSPDDDNFVFDGGGRIYHPSKLEQMNLMLKPAQKVRSFVAFEIHPAGVVNKLMVQRGDKTAVLRYDLRDKVKPLTGPFAANEGKDMLDVGVGALGTPFPLGSYDLTIEKVEESLVNLPGMSLEGGQKILVVTAAIKNASKQPQPLHSSILVPKMVDTDGSTLNYPNAMFPMNGDSNYNSTIDPGAQVRLRFLFYAPVAAKPASVTFTEYYWQRKVTVPLP